MGFSTSYKWSAYITPKSPKGWLESYFFLSKIQLLTSLLNSSAWHLLESSSLFLRRHSITCTVLHQWSSIISQLSSVIFQTTYHQMAVMLCGWRIKAGMVYLRIVG